LRDWQYRNRLSLRKANCRGAQLEQL
jgi:hypothetical protein